MPVTTKSKHSLLVKELNSRFGYLMDALERRELKSAKEGAGKGHWIDPDRMCATRKGSVEIRLAVDDFKNILAEIKKLK